MPAEPVDTNTQLSMRRTGMSFQRTRLSAERTLMSVIRTSLSLISFGFTIYQIFQKAAEHKLIGGGSEPARNFGVTLVLLGIAVLLIGIVYHAMFMAGLRAERRAMAAEGLIRGESRFPPSMTLIAAVLLLAIGLVAVFGIALGIGPLK
jgi:putative membrane protein